MWVDFLPITKSLIKKRRSELWDFEFYPFSDNWGTAADDDTKRVSSRGIIPKAKVKTVKMTLVIVFGKFTLKKKKKKN